ncbi:arsenate-mycothiol transferase ArsC [Geoglobus acetivorans]|uniref:Arsenate reductase n=1 Tax=Geoglobus acetivorans TaxID=565033 RepID=A0A0A7GCW9_GEOAI|nr:Arsenate reductase [Geoglobus acetivorans]
MKVLFVCIENTCRSVMAETVFNSLARNWKAESAGVEAGKEYDIRAVEILEKRGYRVDEGKPKSLKDVNLEDYGLVIAVCGESACVNIPHGNVERWYVEDPKGKSVDEYLRTLSIIEDKVKELLRRLEDESS